MDDQPEAPALPASGEPSRAPPGRQPTYLDQRQRDELLDHVERGKGIDQALRQMKVPYRAYRNTIKSDPEFREEVASARRAADQVLNETGHLKALTEEGSEVLFKVWERRDKGHFLNLARQDRARERAEEMQERKIDQVLRLHLAETRAEAKARERAGSSDAGVATPDFSRLTPEELATLRALLAKACGEVA